MISRHPPGSIGLPCSDNGRFTDFYVDLTGLQVPDGSKFMWKKGAYVADNCNYLAGNFEGEWLWIMGDDHQFPADALMRLLDHDVEVVVPLCLEKKAPFHPVVYKRFDEESERWFGYGLPELAGRSGLIEVEAAGSAGMLIRRSVIERLDPPYFAFQPSKNSPSGHLGEDLWFCKRVRDLGIPIHCDLDLPIGHIVTTSVWPERREDDGKYGVVLDMQLGFRLFMEPSEPEE